MLRKFFGPVNDNGKWRILNNKKTRNLFRDSGIAVHIRARRLKWAGFEERTGDTPKGSGFRQTRRNKTIRETQKKMAGQCERRYRPHGPFEDAANRTDGGRLLARQYPY